jgi:hypothetical protein
VRVVLAVTALRCAAVVFFGFCALSDATIGGGDLNRASGGCVLRSLRSVLLTMVPQLLRARALVRDAAAVCVMFSLLGPCTQFVRLLAVFAHSAS